MPSHILILLLSAGALISVLVVVELASALSRKQTEDLQNIVYGPLRTAKPQSSISPQAASSTDVEVTGTTVMNQKGDIPVLFRAVGLSKNYRTPDGSDVVVLQDADFAIMPGLTAIIGASGTGKTTLFNLLGALDAPTRGELWFQSQRIWPGNAEGLVRHRQSHVAWVFQELHLVEHLRVLDNVSLPSIMKGDPRREAEAVAAEYLELVNLAHVRARLPSQLSRGQRQRVAIARAFACGAPAILADEPTGSLDRQTADSVFAIFVDLARAQERSVVMVTHDELLASQCDQVLRCADGKLWPTCAPLAALGSMSSRSHHLELDDHGAGI